MLMKISVTISIPANFSLLLATTLFIVGGLFSPIIRQIVLFSTNLLYIHFIFNFILVTILLLKKFSSDDNHGDTVSENVKGVDTETTDGECEIEFEHFIINIGSCDHGRGSDSSSDDEEDDNGEIGSDEDEEEEYDDFDLERRAEEFIAKVVDGWREEWLRDNFNYTKHSGI